MASTEGKHWTKQELEFMDHVLDTQRDTTLAGSRRCDYRYKGIDDGDVVWKRCTKAAMVKIRVSHRFRQDTYEAVSCDGCFARNQLKDDDLDGGEKLIVAKIVELEFAVKTDPLDETSPRTATTGELPHSRFKSGSPQQP